MTSKREYGLEFNPHNAILESYEYDFIELVEEEYGTDIALRMNEYFQENNLQSIDAPVEQQFERCKSFIPLLSSDYRLEEFEAEKTDNLNDLTEIHDQDGSLEDDVVDQDVYAGALNQDIPERGVIDYQIVDSLLTGMPLLKDFYGNEEIDTKDVLRLMDKAERNPDFELKTPKHIDKYVEVKHGKEYRSIGKVLDRFESTPAEIDSHKWPRRHELAEASQEENTAVITGNEVYLRDQDTVVIPPDIMEEMLENL